MRTYRRIDRVRALRKLRVLKAKIQRRALRARTTKAHAPPWLRGAWSGV